MKTTFAQNQWNPDALIRSYSFRFTETPDFHQAEDHIYGDVNPDHREGFDNISMLTPQKYSAGVTAILHCSFEDLGCPEIILVPEMETCGDGAVRYGACFEAVMYKDGINVWRHYRENGKCFWHLRLGWGHPLSAHDIHELRLHVRDQYLDITLDGILTSLRTEDLPESFHVGFTVCEGIARIYDFEVISDEAPVSC